MEHFIRPPIFAKETRMMIRKSYRKGLFISFFLLLSLSAAAPDFRVTFIIVTKPVNPFEKLMDAIIKVESSGDTLAINCDEEAIGAFQIRPIRLLDYNQRTGKKYKEADLYNIEISKEIFLYYARKMGYHNFESIAKSWNGSGKSTAAYWQKVKSYL
jgi:hypothetical protein